MTSPTDPTGVDATAAAPTADEPSSPARRLDVPSLVASLVVAALTVVLAQGDLDLHGRWVLPVVLLGIGVATLASTRRR